MSQAGRERIAAAQRARWAASKKSADAPASEKRRVARRPKKRVMSAEARERIAEAQRKRWAATRKRGK